MYLKVKFFSEDQQQFGWGLGPGQSPKALSVILGNKSVTPLKSPTLIYCKISTLRAPRVFCKRQFVNFQNVFSVFKFNTRHLSLLLRICRSLGTYKDGFGISLKFRTAHHLLYLGLTPMGWIRQGRATLGAVYGIIYTERGSLGELGGLGYSAWVFISNTFMRKINKI